MMFVEVGLSPMSDNPLPQFDVMQQGLDPVDGVGDRVDFDGSPEQIRHGSAQHRLEVGSVEAADE